MKWINRWTKEVQRLTGLPNKRMVIYTGSWWWGRRLATHEIRQEGLPPVGLGLWRAARDPRLEVVVVAIHRPREGSGINGGTDANVWKSSNASLRKAAGLPPLP